jgi:integrase
VVFLLHSGERVSRTYSDRESAMRAVRRYTPESSAPTLSQALADYMTDMERRGLKKTTRTTTWHRLRKLVEGSGATRVDRFSEHQAKALYQALAETTAGDTALNTLNQARTWGRWLVDTRRASTNPWLVVKPRERRRSRANRDQLRVDELRKLTAVCFDELAEESSEGALATLCCLYLGLRASEVCGLRVRDIDDGARLLWVADSKTDAGRRLLEVPEVLQPSLVVACAGKRPSDSVLSLSRYGVYYHVKRLCKAAGVPEKGPHSLRGSHSTLAMSAGATGQQAAQALGHTSEAVTFRHYVEAGTVDRKKVEQVAQRVGGKNTPPVVPRFTVIEGGLGK